MLSRKLCQVRDLDQFQALIGFLLKSVNFIQFNVSQLQGNFFFVFQILKYGFFRHGTSFLKQFLNEIFHFVSSQ